MDCWVCPLAIPGAMDAGEPLIETNLVLKLDKHMFLSCYNNMRVDMHANRCGCAAGAIAQPDASIPIFKSISDVYKNVPITSNTTTFKRVVEAVEPTILTSEKLQGTLFVPTDAVSSKESLDRNAQYLLVCSRQQYCTCLFTLDMCHYHLGVGCMRATVDWSLRI